MSAAPPPSPRCFPAASWTSSSARSSTAKASRSWRPMCRWYGWPSARPGPQTAEPEEPIPVIFETHLSPYSHYAERQLEEAQTPCRVVARVDDHLVRSHLVAAGLGCTAIPKFLMRSCPPQPERSPDFPKQSAPASASSTTGNQSPTGMPPRKSSSPFSPPPDSRMRTLFSFPLARPGGSSPLHRACIRTDTFIRASLRRGHLSTGRRRLRYRRGCKARRRPASRGAAIGIYCDGWWSGRNRASRCGPSSAPNG